MQNTCSSQAIAQDRRSVIARSIKREDKRGGEELRIQVPVLFLRRVSVPQSSVEIRVEASACCIETFGDDYSLTARSHRSMTQSLCLVVSWASFCSSPR